MLKSMAIKPSILQSFCPFWLLVFSYIWDILHLCNTKHERIQAAHKSFLNSHKFIFEIMWFSLLHMHKPKALPSSLNLSWNKLGLQINFSLRKGSHSYLTESGNYGKQSTLPRGWRTVLQKPENTSHKTMNYFQHYAIYRQMIRLYLYPFYIYRIHL